MKLYEMLKDTCKYAEMPQAASEKVIDTLVAKAHTMNVPAANVEKIAILTKNYCLYVIENTTISGALRTFDTIISYIEDDRYFQEGLRMINNRYIA